MRWLTFWNPSLQPAASPTNVSLSPESSTAMFGDRTPINTETNPDSYVLLCSQLRSAAEKRGADLSKSVMSDLERRLIQKEKGGSFETFLVAILLLNCVERTCWLFRSWENPLHGSRVCAQPQDLLMSLNNTDLVASRPPTEGLLRARRPIFGYHQDDLDSAQTTS